MPPNFHNSGQFRSKQYFFLKKKKKYSKRHKITKDGKDGKNNNREIKPCNPKEASEPLDGCLDLRSNLVPEGRHFYIENTIPRSKRRPC